MTNKTLQRRIARALQRSPFVMRLAYVVIRAFQPRFSVGVVAVIINPQGQVLLAEHTFHPVAPWGLPGGWIKRGESLAACAQREVREELSLDIEIERLLTVEITQEGHVDAAMLCRPRGQVGTLSLEITDCRWFDVHQLARMIGFHRFAVEYYITHHLNSTQTGKMEHGD